MKRVISIVSSLVLSCAIPVAFGAVEILDKVIAAEMPNSTRQTNYAATSDACSLTRRCK